MSDDDISGGFYKPWYQGPIGWALALVIALAGCLAVYAGYRNLTTAEPPAMPKPADVRQAAVSSPEASRPLSAPDAAMPSAPPPPASQTAGQTLPAAPVAPPTPVAAPEAPAAPAATPSAAPAAASQPASTPAPEAPPTEPVALPGTPGPAPVDVKEAENWVAKEAAFARFYKKPTMCENPASQEIMVECGNRYVRARRAFEEKWTSGQKQ